MNNSKLQSKITCQCAVNKTIVATTSSLLKSNNVTENIASLNPFKFSSEYHDSALGLVYYNYRHYNPNDGRWLSRDPIAEKGGYNLYGMLANNVINLYDLLGLDEEDPCDIKALKENTQTQLTSMFETIGDVSNDSKLKETILFLKVLTEVDNAKNNYCAVKNFFELLLGYTQSIVYGDYEISESLMKAELNTALAGSIQYYGGFMTTEDAFNKIVEFRNAVMFYRKSQKTEGDN